MTRKCTTMLLALLALVVVASTLHAQGDNSDRGIVPPQARFRGFTRGELGAIFWQTALSIPIVEGDHPFISGGAMQGPDGIVFLTGVFSTDPAVVEITIPAGTPLFFPVINAECSMFEPDPFHGDDEE